MSSRPLLIALTGGIASGKSVVAELFAKLGVPVLDADVIAREVVEPGTPALAAIVAQFGNSALDANGRFDRAAMRKHVFANPEERKRLEAITHPAIRAEFARQSAAAGGAYQIHVIPLIVETGRTDQYDRVLVVDASEEEQLRRLTARDQTNGAEARRILAAQVSRQQRLEVADDLIVNMGSVADLERFVATLHANYAELARRMAQE